MKLSEIKDHISINEIPELAALSNDRARNFCIFYVANGGNGAAAARDAGYSDLNANRNGGAMARKYRDAIDAIRSWYFNSNVMTKAEAMSILSRQGRGSLGDVLDDDGNISGQLVKQNGKIVDSFSTKRTVTEDGESYEAKVKMLDSRGAIDTLAKIAGWYKDDIKLKCGNVEFELNLGGVR